jgi:hypothetical protein
VAQQNSRGGPQAAPCVEHLHAKATAPNGFR